MMHVCMTSCRNPILNSYLPSLCRRRRTPPASGCRPIRARLLPIGTPGKRRTELLAGASAESAKAPTRARVLARLLTCLGGERRAAGSARMAITPAIPGWARPSDSHPSAAGQRQEAEVRGLWGGPRANPQAGRGRPAAHRKLREGRLRPWPDRLLRRFGQGPSTALPKLYRRWTTQSAAWRIVRV